MGEDHQLDPETQDMSQDQKKPLSIAERKAQAEADAILAQMFGYYAREETPRAVKTEYDAPYAA